MNPQITASLLATTAALWFRDEPPSAHANCGCPPQRRRVDRAAAHAALDRLESRSRRALAPGAADGRIASADPPH